LVAIEREEQIKRWRRSKKLALVRIGNPLLEALQLKETG
jgi:predicted GIY-YIG superfamily endonuclease